jgi:hypothetical protein
MAQLNVQAFKTIIEEHFGDNYTNELCNSLHSKFSNINNEPGRQHKMDRNGAIEFITQTDQYAERKQQIFNDTFIDVFGIDPDHIDSVAQVLMKQVYQTHSSKLPVPLHKTTLNSLIKRDDAFVKRYIEVMKFVYKSLHNSTINDTEARKLVHEHFINKNNSILSFYKFIEATVKSVTTTDNVAIELSSEKPVTVVQEPMTNTNNKPEDPLLIKIHSQWTSMYNHSLSEYDLCNIIIKLQNQDETLGTVLNNIKPYYNKNNISIISTFLEVYGREITVYEYTKYYDHLIMHINDLSTIIKDIKSHFNKCFTEVKEVYMQYINATITEIDFIKKYIITIDNPEYITIIIDELINVDAYNVNMCTKISGVYQGLFTTNISEEDLNYIMNIIHRRKLPLISEDIHEIITQIKTKTDDYYKRTEIVFKDIIEREPELEEYIEYKRMFRDNETNDDKGFTERTMRTNLYDSLEYHDIIKTIIKKENPRITQAQLFKALQNVLQNTKIKTNKAALGTVVSV